MRKDLLLTRKFGRPIWAVGDISKKMRRKSFYKFLPALQTELGSSWELTSTLSVYLEEEYL